MRKALVLSVLLIVVCISASAQLPAIQLKDTDGKSMSMSELNKKGHPVILSFFATWCKPCLRELSAINEVYADWQEETGVELIAISIDQGQDVAKVKPLVDGSAWDFKVLLDPGSDLKRAMGVNVIPHVFLLDGEGNIVSSHIGYTEGGDAVLFDEVKKLVNK